MVDTQQTVKDHMEWYISGLYSSFDLINLVGILFA